MLYGVAPQQIAYTMNMALSNKSITTLYDESSVNQIGLLLSLEEKEKSNIQDITQLKVKSTHGNLVSIADLINIEETTSAKSIYRKNHFSYQLNEIVGMNERRRSETIKNMCEALNLS